MAERELTRQELAPLLDSTLLHPAASEEDIIALVDHAIAGGCQVCVNESRLGQVISRIKDIPQDIHHPRVSSVIGFPLGATTTGMKVHSAKTVLSVGADEIDMVANAGWLKEGSIEKYREDILKVAGVCAEFNAAHNQQRVLKVIIETCYFSGDEKRRAAGIIAGISRELTLPMFVKTSTGFGSPPEGVAKGATVEDVALLRKECGPYHPKSNMVGIKASGGIKSVQDCQKMISAACSLNAGEITPLAARIGTSSAAAILG